MKMALHVINPFEGDEYPALVNFDSSHPEDSVKELGHEWIDLIRKHPSLIRKGASINSATRGYYVISVESPLFDNKTMYYQERPEYENGPVFILSSTEKNGIWIYQFRWMVEREKVFRLYEDDLMRFLTESVHLNELKEV